MTQEDYARALAQMLPTISLDELQDITEKLDQELAESQRIMTQIRKMFDDVSKVSDVQDESFNGQPVYMVKHEDVSKFLEADAPKLLKSDMSERSLEVDIDVIIENMKKRAEELRKNVLDAQPRSQSFQREFENLDMKEYAATLDNLSKRLTNIKLNKNDEVRNPHLEEKLKKLCNDVNLFTQMVETKTAISECNKKFSDQQEDNNVLYYDNIVNKLLGGINEVTYLLKSKN